jgi:hypothetical protein
MNIIDYVTFTQKPRGEYGIVSEHAEVPTFTLAYYFETLLNGNHPDHDAVVEFAHEIMARAHEEKMAAGRRSMDETRASMTDEEWSRIVD